jgi:hypothetical protein
MLLRDHPPNNREVLDTAQLLQGFQQVVSGQIFSLIESKGDAVYEI